MADSGTSTPDVERHVVLQGFRSDRNVQPYVEHLGPDGACAPQP